MDPLQQLQEILLSVVKDTEQLTRQRMVRSKDISLSTFGLDNVVFQDQKVEFKLADIKQKEKVRSVFYVVLFCVSRAFRNINDKQRDAVMLELYMRYKWPLDLVGLLKLLDLNCIAFLSCETGLQKRETRQQESIRALKQEGLGLQQPSGFRVELPMKKRSNRPYIFLLTRGDERYSPIFYESEEQMFLMPYELGQLLEVKIPTGPCLTYERGAFVRYQNQSWMIVAVNREQNTYTLERTDSDNQLVTVDVVPARDIDASTPNPNGILDGAVFVDDRFVLYAYKEQDVEAYIESLKKKVTFET